MQLNAGIFGGQHRRGLLAVIASITIVGIVQSAVAPLLSLNLEQRGIEASWNGLLAAMPPLATLALAAYIPTIVRRIGAVTSIYAGAGISLMALLLFPLLESLPAWFVLRFAMGAAMGVVWVVTETWINALAPEKNRGTVMGVYVSVLCIGLATGPLLLGLTGSAGALPFIGSAIILGIAMLPIPFASGSGGSIPTLRDRKVLGLAEAVRRAPAVMIAGLLNGGIWTTQIALLPVYGVRVNLPEDQALFLLTAYIVGNIVLQLPIGRLLDRWSASSVLLLCSSIQCLGAIVVPLVVHDGAVAWLSLLVWGGFLGGLYTTELTMLGRTFALDDLSGASTAFNVAFSIGALAGPIVAGVAMQIWNPHGMLVVIGVSGAALAIMAIRVANGQQSR